MFKIKPIKQKLFFIRTKHKCNEPIFDYLTMKMARAIDEAKVCKTHDDIYYSKCGVASTNFDYMIKGGFIVNSLCVHYVACHRDELSEQHLRMLDKLYPNKEYRVRSYRLLYYPENNTNNPRIKERKLYKKFNKRLDKLDKMMNDFTIKLHKIVETHKDNKRSDKRSGKRSDKRNSKSKKHKRR